MSITGIDSFEILKKYNLYEEAKKECERQKIENAPYDMQGHNNIYCGFLDKKWREIRDVKLKKQECRCTNQDAVISENSPHDICVFNRDAFAKKGLCKSCELGKELDILESELNELSCASKALEEAAERDYYLR